MSDGQCSFLRGVEKHVHTDLYIDCTDIEYRYSIDIDA